MFQKKSRAPLAILILSNLIPLIGIFLFNWQAQNILAAYWLESAIVGLFFILKITLSNKRRLPIALPKIYLILFFIFHFSIFMFAHLYFLVSIIFLTFSPKLSAIFPLLAKSYPLIIALFISHLFSFAYIDKKEKPLSQKDFLLEPYKRIFIMQITILVLALIIFPLITLNISINPKLSATILVLIKTIFDARAHSHTNL